MKKLIIFIFGLVQSFLLVSFLYSQETVSASGGNANGNGGNISYTIGQIVYNTNEGTNGSVSQGVQQPYEISVVSGSNEPKEISLYFSVYPNPATDLLFLEIKEGRELLQDIGNKKYIATLYDINGKVLEIHNLKNNLTKIDMGKYAPDVYFLRIAKKGFVIKVFKIIKNK